VPSSLFSQSQKNRHKCPVCKVLDARDASYKAYKRQSDKEDDELWDDVCQGGMFEY
jgi:hypothetical protein